MIKYNQDFINRCKKTYPNNELLHKLLDSGSARVGLLLNEWSDENPEEYSWDFQGVDNEITLQDRINLYGEWADFTAEWYEKNRKDEQVRASIARE